LAPVEVLVKSMLAEQLVVRAALDDRSLFDHQKG
jgi:hypothetical protein